VKGLINRITRRLGYEIVYYQPHRIGRPVGIGADPLEDMARFLREPQPLIFDVGANIGQSIEQFRLWFPDCVIHSFEPSPKTFRTLRRNTFRLKNVQLWNCALGATPGQETLLENSYSTMSSFLPLGTLGWGEPRKETPVEVRTVDELCLEQGIERIDVLKSDTQGFELEVFKGAEATMRANRIGLVFYEVIFSELYRGLPPYHELFRFLTERGFQLASIYDLHYRRHLAGWGDALFVHHSLLI
jgi:FkbM family methyltransferase